MRSPLAAAMLPTRDALSARGVYAASAWTWNGAPEYLDSSARRIVLNSWGENSTHTADSERSNGVAADSSPRREPWVTRKHEASRGAAAEAHTNRWSGPPFCRPSGAGQVAGIAPTAHAVGYCLSLLRSSASPTHAKPHDLTRFGVFTHPVQAAETSTRSERPKQPKRFPPPALW